MKNYLLIPFFLLACLTINAQDYKWTVQGDSDLSFTSGDGYSGGEINVMALYSFTEKLQAGASLGLGFGDLEADAAITAAARYFVTDTWFAYGEYALTETAGVGGALGAGYRFKIADRIEFNPTAVYELECKKFVTNMGFAIRF
ncbi:hypothetical protein N9C25_05280 [Saprospiraceae bacterium]|nr:hypothetical protein [Saprospiraceae bacterium]